jgi:hypothetical protein
MHITYGSILSAKDNSGRFVFRDRFFKMLYENEAQHYQCLEKHIGRHFSLLGVKPRS